MLCAGCNQTDAAVHRAAGGGMLDREETRRIEVGAHGALVPLPTASTGWSEVRPDGLQYA